MSGLKEVELVSTGVYLPGEPVPFDMIEEVIGYLDQAPQIIQKTTQKLRPAVKDLIGIEQCYFAVDPKAKTLTESNTSMAVKAIRTALKKAKTSIDEIECIILACPLPDQQTPPTTTLIQHELGIEKCAEMEIHSNCTGMTKAFQVAFDGLRLGRYKTVVVVYAQLSSAYLLARHYNQKVVKTENVLLRWFLSDSASALVLRAKEKVDSGIKVLDVYNESVGGGIDPAMWFKHGASNFDYLNAYEKGYHHLGQDYRTVVETGEKYFVEGFRRMMNRTDINLNEINHLLATIPSTKLQDKAKKAFSREFSIPHDKWYSNIKQNGYSGGSSVVIGLDQMLNDKLFKPGELLTGITIESSKWMFGGFSLRYL